MLGGTALNGIPIIAERLFQSTARLPFGEWAVVGGLLNAQEAHTLSGLAGLARVPFLGPLASTRSATNDDSRVLILIRPTLITAPQPEQPPIFVGTFNRPVTPL